MKIITGGFFFFFGEYFGGVITERDGWHSMQ